MSWLRALSIVLFVSAIVPQPACANPITLAFHEIVMGPYDLPDTTVTTPDLSNGGSFSIGGPSLGVTSSDITYTYPAPVQSVDGTFGFLVGVATAPGSDQWAGPSISVTGNIGGSIISPGNGWRFSGTLSGTATAASLVTGSAADLPAPLLDILANPGHLHVSSVVDDGNQNMLDFTLTFDPPTPLPAPIPEPTALAVLVVGLGAMHFGRRYRRHRRPCS
jgi:hypothetical protein